MAFFQFIDPVNISFEEPRNPTANDDLDFGVLPTNLWLNTVSHQIWVNVSNIVGDAVWKEYGFYADFLFDSEGKLVYIKRPPERSQLLTV